MNYESGYTASFYAAFIDPISWHDRDRFELIDGSVSRTDDGLRQSADLECTDYDETQERWIRIYMDANQSGNVTHEALFTGIATSPSHDIDGQYVERSVECYSVLKPCEDILLPRGWHVRAGTNGIEAIMELLKATPAPIEAEEGAPLLSNTIIAEDDETNLSMIDAILSAINWRLQIRGDGTIVLSPLPDTESATFSADGLDILQTSLSVDRDWFNCPNVFRASSDDMISIARDDDPSSALSTVARGREIWMGDDDVDLSDDETIAEYAVRRLKEEQQVAETAKYTRRYIPEVNVGDLVKLNYDQIKGTYTVTSQTIQLTYAATTDEEVECLK